MSSAAQRRPAEVAGYLEAVTGAALLGWAWAPGSPAARVTVEAWLDGQAVAAGTADEAREDLARNGIGDGRHAFRLPVPEALRARVAELRLTARLGEGERVPLAMPDHGAPPGAAADGIAERLDRLQRGVEALGGAHRVMHRMLQTLLTRPASEPEATDTQLREQLATLEVIALRLDDRLSALAAPVPGRGKPLAGRAAWAALALAGLALAGSLWGLVRSLP